MHSCSSGEETQAGKARKAEEEKRTLAALLKESTMADEIDRLLAAHIKIIPDFIVVEDAYGSYAFPAKTSWTVECGPFGLKINFGDLFSDAVLSSELFGGPIVGKRCERVIAATVARFQTYLRVFSTGQTR